MGPKYGIAAAASLATVLIALIGWMGNLVVMGVNENQAELAILRNQLTAMESRQDTYLKEVLSRMDRQDARIVRLETLAFAQAARDEARRNKETASTVPGL